MSFCPWKQQQQVWKKNPICKSTALFVLYAAEYFSRAASHKYVHFCEMWSEAETILIQRETALPTFSPDLKVKEQLRKLNLIWTE